MPRFPKDEPVGVIPAVLLPFHEDLSIDERSFKAHLTDIANVEGLSAITVNAHSTEVASCTADEQRLVMEIAGETVGDRLSRLEGGDPAQDPSGIPSVCRPGRDEEELAALRW